jgi:hypothetical protein
MPSKAQRAASRQARLSRRRRRGKAAPQNFHAEPTKPNAVAESSVDAPRHPVRQAASLSARTSASASMETRSAPRGRRRAVDAGASNVSRYLGRELRQIGAISSLIAVILVGLTFVLG